MKFAFIRFQLLHFRQLYIDLIIHLQSMSIELTIKSLKAI